LYFSLFSPGSRINQSFRKKRLISLSDICLFSRLAFFSLSLPPSQLITSFKSSYHNVTMGKTQPNLFAFRDVNALAPALRSYVIQSQAAGIARHGAFKVAVSGGSLPKTLAQALLAPSSGPNDVVDFAL
jgi:hypothetical protein